MDHQNKPPLQILQKNLDPPLRETLKYKMLKFKLCGNSLCKLQMVFLCGGGPLENHLDIIAEKNLFHSLSPTT